VTLISPAIFLFHKHDHNNETYEAIFPSGGTLPHISLPTHHTNIKTTTLTANKHEPCCHGSYVEATYIIDKTPRVPHITSIYVDEVICDQVKNGICMYTMAARYPGLTAASTKITAFSAIAPCSLVEID
jgi:hypothetical protein